MNIEDLLPVPLITALVQLMKYLGLPKKYIFLSVFFLATVSALLFFYSKDLLVTLVTFLIYFFGAIGLYESSFKPMNSLMEKGVKDTSKKKKKQ